MPRIATWNSRGDPRNDPTKAAELAQLVANNDYVLLQEAGNLAAAQSYEAGGVQYTVYGAPQAGAFNVRCGTAVLTRRPSTLVPPQTLQSANGRSALAVQDTGSNVIIGTMHSNASANAAHDRNAAMRGMPSGAVILGGDFNVAPAGAMVNVGSNSRPDVWDQWSPGAPTHFGPNGSSELDYFVSRNVHNVNVATAPGQHGTAGSDHRWVQMQF